jgi:hypothetical protein
MQRKLEQGNDTEARMKTTTIRVHAGIAHLANVIAANWEIKPSEFFRIAIRDAVLKEAEINPDIAAELRQTALQEHDRFMENLCKDFGELAVEGALHDLGNEPQ